MTKVVEEFWADGMVLSEINRRLERLEELYVLSVDELVRYIAERNTKFPYEERWYFHCEFLYHANAWELAIEWKNRFAVKDSEDKALAEVGDTLNKAASALLERVGK